MTDSNNPSNTYTSSELSMLLLGSSTSALPTTALANPLAGLHKRGVTSTSATGAAAAAGAGATAGGNKDHDDLSGLDAAQASLLLKNKRALRDCENSLKNDVGNKRHRRVGKDGRRIVRDYHLLDFPVSKDVI